MESEIAKATGNCRTWSREYFKLDYKATVLKDKTKVIKTVQLLTNGTNIAHRNRRENSEVNFQI